MLGSTETRSSNALRTLKYERYLHQCPAGALNISQPDATSNAPRGGANKNTSQYLLETGSARNDAIALSNQWLPWLAGR